MQAENIVKKRHLSINDGVVEVEKSGGLASKLPKIAEEVHLVKIATSVRNINPRPKWLGIFDFHGLVKTHQSLVYFGAYARTFQKLTLKLPCTEASIRKNVSAAATMPAKPSVLTICSLKPLTGLPNTDIVSTVLSANSVIGVSNNRKKPLG